MSAFSLTDSELMSLRAFNCFGDDSIMQDVKGQSHGLYAHADNVAMHSHIVLACCWRSRHDRWRDQRFEVSALRLQKRLPR